MIELGAWKQKGRKEGHSTLTRMAWADYHPEKVLEIPSAVVPAQNGTGVRWGATAEHHINFSAAARVLLGQKERPASFFIY